MYATHHVSLFIPNSTSTVMLIFELESRSLEVAMGGRRVLIDALASVDLDHQVILVHTVQEIAGEKRRIAGKGKPFVLGR